MSFCLGNGIGPRLKKIMVIQRGIFMISCTTYVALNIVATIRLNLDPYLG